ncbi:unnamed protein product [Sphagnum balticum]
MHTNHKNHANNNNDHKGSENQNRTGSREAREGQVSKGSVWAGSFDGQQLGVRSAPVSMAIRTLSVRTPTVSHMHWALGTVDARVSM